jgi:hypothetical protein
MKPQRTQRGKPQPKISLAESAEGSEKSSRFLNNFIDFFLSVLRDLCEIHSFFLTKFREFERQAY